MDKVFIEKIKMETQTVFHENGRVSIIPHVTNRNISLTGDEGRQTVQRGRMITDDDGRSIFHPYMESGIPRYRLMMSTDHGDAKETQAGNMVVTFRLPQDANMPGMLVREAKEIAKRLGLRIVGSRELLQKQHLCNELIHKRLRKQKEKPKKSNQKKI